MTPGADACADYGGRLRRIGKDVTEGLEPVPGTSPLSSDPWRDHGSTSQTASCDRGWMPADRHAGFEDP